MSTAEDNRPAAGVPAEDRVQLVGPPTFTELPNGRFKCLETGHEMLAKDIESYKRSKRCRIGLIDFALSRNDKAKTPLNMFKQDPLCRSKLICKLTGDRVNKSEEHIWKHVNGKRFLNRLEQKEAEMLNGDASTKEDNKENVTRASIPRQRGVNRSKKKEQTVDEIISDIRGACGKDSDSEYSDTSMSGNHCLQGNQLNRTPDSGLESGDDDETEVCLEESEEISQRTKRMTIEIGPSSFARRKKKPKTGSTC